MKTLLAVCAAMLLLSACSKQPEKSYQPSYQQQIEGSDRAIRALDREKY